MSNDQEERDTVLMFGIGKLAGPVLDVLASKYPAHRYVFISRSRERSARRANLTKYLAAQLGSFPDVYAEESDLLDTHRTAELLSRYRPSIVFNATTPFAWWKLDSLPARERELSNRAGPGMWSALDCLLPLKLTQGIHQSGVRPFFVNACYPDMTNAFLSAYESAPTVGIGNISNLVPGIRLAFAAEWQERPEAIEVQLVGHHYLSWNAPTPTGSGSAPYDLTITSPTRRVRYRGPEDEPFRILRLHATRVRGLEGLGVTVGSATSVVSSLLERRAQRHHCPGALGLPGGYPVVIDKERSVSLDLPAELSRDEAINVNELSQLLDGVGAVSPGNVLASPSAQNAYKELFGEDLPLITEANLERVARSTIEQLRYKYSIDITLQ